MFLASHSTSFNGNIMLSFFRWIENVLQRIRHCLKTAVKRLAMCQQDNDEMTKKQRNRLRLLKENAETEIRTLKADVVEKEKQLFVEVKEYLSSPIARVRICSAWKPNEIPVINNTIRDPKHWLFVKQRIEEAFYDRVCNEIEEWTDDKDKVSNVEQELVENIESRLGILQGEIIESEYDMDTQASLRSNDSSVSTRSRTKRRVSLRPASIEIPMKLPLKITYRINGLGIGGEKNKFNRDPFQWVQKRSEKLLEKLLKNKKKDNTAGLFDMLISQLMQRPHSILDTLELKIPSILEANMNLLDTLEELRLDQHRYANDYEKMAEDIEILKETLMSYGQGYIFVHDFKSSEIRNIQEQKSTGDSLTKTFKIQFSDLVSSRSGRQSVINRPSLVPQGLWSFITSGMLQRDNREKPISIRLYTAASGIINTISEVAKLRYVHLLHNHIYKFVKLWC